MGMGRSASHTLSLHLACNPWASLALAWGTVASHRVGRVLDHTSRDNHRRTLLALVVGRRRSLGSKMSLQVAFRVAGGHPYLLGLSKCPWVGEVGFGRPSQDPRSSDSPGQALQGDDMGT
eukprot:CAMPEP_0117737178 /NCGR_PEP_ID=MMETSP0947-20121206/2371_1 /TAXON_ID=44440 /ORGANISM="Chattonella subsalsa, Strain CCMP2191" /LENGTH=119 /DNA_ID=CAMNT_0005552611 /DNA_START=499 /DNA_END=858 /DNA_ORIENTATION=-